MHAWQRVLDPNCNWCCTTAPGVAHLQLMFAHLQLVLRHCDLYFKKFEWCRALQTQVLYHCTAHTGAVPLYCTNRCSTTALNTRVLYHCTAHPGAVPLYCTHRCCTTVLHTQVLSTVLHTKVLYHCTANTGAVPLYCTTRCCATVLHAPELYHYCAQWRMEPPGKSLGQTPSGPEAPRVFGLETPLGNPPTTIPPQLFHTLSPNLGGTSKSLNIKWSLLQKYCTPQAPHSQYLYTIKVLPKYWAHVQSTSSNTWLVHHGLHWVCPLSLIYPCR